MILDGWSDRGRDDFDFLMTTILSPDVSSECSECGRGNVAKVRPIQREGRIILRWRSPDGKLHAEVLSEPVARLVRVLGLHETARLVGNHGGTTISLPKKADEKYGKTVRAMSSHDVARLIEAFGPGPLEVPKDKPFVTRVTLVSRPDNKSGSRPHPLGEVRQARGVDFQGQRLDRARTPTGRRLTMPRKEKQLATIETPIAADETDRLRAALDQQVITERNPATGEMEARPLPEDMKALLGTAFAALPPAAPEEAEYEEVVSPSHLSAIERLVSDMRQLAHRVLGLT